MPGSVVPEEGYAAMTKTVRVGTSGWSYPHWKAVFYPEGLARARWFEFYSRTFSTVEVNATFYRFFKESTYCKWRDTAPEGFRYVLKVPRVITHRKFLAGVDEDIRRFCASAAILEHTLGLLLLQLAPQTPYDPDRLGRALRAFEDPSRVAVEFRHKRWLNEQE